MHEQFLLKYPEINVTKKITRIWNQEIVYIIQIVFSTIDFIQKHLLHSLKMLNIEQYLYIKQQKSAILNTWRHCYNNRVLGNRWK